MWPALLAAGGLSLANLVLLALVATVLARFLLPRVPRAVDRAPFRGGVAVVSVALAALLATATIQIAMWATAFVVCGEFLSFEDAFYHSAVNYSTLGYGDLVMSKRWRLLGPLEALNGSLMLGLSAAVLFSAMNRVFRAGTPRNDAE